MQAAQRAVRVGFEAIELHVAHGYLLHEFVSPLSNTRTDSYGGSLENRMRFPLEVAHAVRAVVPKSVVLGARITGSDWMEGGVTPDDAVALAKGLKAASVDYACVSSGGVVATAKIAFAPNYQVPFAAKVQGRGRHRHPRRRPDRRAGPGRSHHQLGPGRLRGAGARPPR